MVKKLKYLILILPFIFITNVNAQTYSLNYYHFSSSSTDYSQYIQCSGDTCRVYDVPFPNVTRFSFEWGTNNAPQCSSNAVISGLINNYNTNFGIVNNDFTWLGMYLSQSGNVYPCSFSVYDYGTEFVCTVPSLASNFRIGFTFKNDFQTSTNFIADISKTVDINCDTTSGQIIQNNNSNTQNIINNNNSNSQNIINNQTQNTQEIINNNVENTQDIIDNQNSNTQQEIESQKVCRYIDKKDIVLEKHGLDSNGYLTNTNNYGITDYIPISNSSELKIYIGNGYTNYMCFYNRNKEVISCLSYSNVTPDTINGTSVTIPSGTFYFRAPINYSYNRPTFDLCNNGNQVLNDSVNNLNDTLNSTDTPDTENELADLDSSLISDTPISDLITLPITLLNSYIIGFNSSCSPYNLGNLLGTDLILPCINLQQRLGSNLWTVIDSLFSIFMIYNIAMLFITAFDGFTSLRDDYESLYQPKHADTGYQPKHGGGS